MNFVLAMLLVICIVSTTAVVTPEITALSEGYPAQQAGLQIGDVITKINHKNMKKFCFQNVSPFVHNNWSAMQPGTLFHYSGFQKNSNQFVKLSRNLYDLWVTLPPYGGCHSLKIVL